jgi:hypothetical protein
MIETGPLLPLVLIGAGERVELLPFVSVKPAGAVMAPMLATLLF